MFYEACDICNPVSVVLKWFEDLRMEIQNASASSSKSNKLRNANTGWWKSRYITTRPGEIDDRSFAFFVNACLNITAINNLYILTDKRRDTQNICKIIH